MLQIVVPILTVVLVLAGAYVWQGKRARALRTTRSHYTRDAFIRECGANGIRADVAASCWDVLIEWLGRDQFPVNLNDSLSSQLRMAGDDLDDTIVEVALRSGRQRPSTKDVAGLEPVKTVRDLVVLVSRLPSRSSERPD